MTEAYLASQQKPKASSCQGEGSPSDLPKLKMHCFFKARISIPRSGSAEARAQQPNSGAGEYACSSEGARSSTTQLGSGCGVAGFPGIGSRAWGFGRSKVPEKDLQRKAYCGNAQPG